MALGFFIFLCLSNIFINNKNNKKKLWLICHKKATTSSWPS